MSCIVHSGKLEYTDNIVHIGNLIIE